MRKLILFSLVISACSAPLRPEAIAPPGDNATPPLLAPLVVEVVDVGQGDAIWIENGRTRLLVDAGQSLTRMRDLIEEKGLKGDTIDAFILTHAHADHHAGFREFFRTEHDITIRAFYENGDPASGVMIRELRDSIHARVNRDQMELRSTDDPCGDGRPICTLSLGGGARLHILPPPNVGSANDRSVGLKLIGPDSASFTMWLSGDAERTAMRHFLTTHRDTPGLRVHVLKGNHHGSCNGTTVEWLRGLQPEWVTFGVSSTNGFGHVHEQTKRIHRDEGVPWLRTDQNGRITFWTAGAPGSGCRRRPQSGCPSCALRRHRLWAGQGQGGQAGQALREATGA